MKKTYQTIEEAVKVLANHLMKSKHVAASLRQQAKQLETQSQQLKKLADELEKEDMGSQAKSGTPPNAATRFPKANAADLRRKIDEDNRGKK